MGGAVGGGQMTAWLRGLTSGWSDEIGGLPGCWRSIAIVIAKGHGMLKIWSALVAVAAEGMVLAWLVGEHAWLWLGSGVIGR